MEIFLQVWGGSFYLLAKIFLSYAEGKANSKWRVFGWVIYLLGVPPWLIILSFKHDWILLAIEIGGVPSMLLGIVVTLKTLQKIPKWIDKCIKVFTWTIMITGISYSLYDFGGITSLSQILECFITIGFLAGTYLLAKKDGRGWMGFILMNISCTILMAIQGKWLLFITQALSIIFGVIGFIRSKKEKK